MSPVKVVHFSDVLCIWAHVSQDHTARLVAEFGQDIEVEQHFCSVFPDTRAKISKAWAGRGGFAGYAGHVNSVAARFHTTLHPDTWQHVQPRSSASPHLFLTAVDLWEKDQGPHPGFADRLAVRAATALRRAFFGQGQDIATWDVQRGIATSLGLDFAALLQRIETGEAMAALAGDYELAQAMGVQGSPTYILNEGRQKLFGDIGYRILAANVSEVLAHAKGETASLA